MQTCNVRQKMQGTRQLNQLQIICLLLQSLNSFQGAEHFTGGSPDSCPYSLHISSIIKHPSGSIHIFQLLMDPPQILVWICLQEHTERCHFFPLLLLFSAKIKG